MAGCAWITEGEYEHAAEACACRDPDLFADRDADGYGDPALPWEACDTAVCGDFAFVANDGDCDDGDPDAHPGAAEVQDGVDNDCDGLTDEP
jgi:hypothetical protein